MNKKLQQINHCQRRGLVAMEMLVAIVVLCATVTVVTGLLFKCGMIWRDVSQYRVAVHELSAQLEELTLMDANSVTERIDQLKPSAVSAERLPDAKLSGLLVKDSLGTRVELSINWKRMVESKPVVLCGWLIESEDSE